jgi:cytochrome o ubiquinol oxidase operon protein cyoD
MHDHQSLNEIKKEWHGTLKSYLVGLIACLILTSASFLIVTQGLLTGQALIYALVGLAFTQAIFQLMCFLHEGQEASPRWETLVFYFMILVLLIIVIGSLWIMADLNKRVMPPMNPKEMAHD